MIIRIAAAAALLVAFGSEASAQICGSVTAFSNGSPADATAVNANFTALVNCVNSGAAPIAGPIFTGNVGIDPASSALTPLYVSGTELPAFTGTTRGVVSVTGTYSPGYYIPIDFLYGDNQPPSARIAAYDDGGGSRLVFGTSNHYASGITNAALTIDSVGHVNIGASTSTYSLYVNGTAAGTSAYANLSDERLKKNIVPISNPLAILDRLQGVRFEWREPSERFVGKDLNLAVHTPQVGFVAQALKPVLPEAVNVAPDKDALMTVQESKIIPVLVEALKEIVAANKTQSAQIAELRDEVSAMKHQIDTRMAQADLWDTTRHKKKLVQ